mgnify:FL=1
MGMIDTHAHYDASQFDGERDEVIRDVFANGVDKIITCATNFEDGANVLELCEKYDGMYAAIGIYPHETVKYEWDKQRLVDMISHEKVVAVGEIGLDYYYDDSPKDTQIKWVENQLALANELDLPISFHDREAHFDTMELLKKYRPKGVVHCFSGSVESAKETVKLGLSLGIGGVLTFKNARVLPEVVKAVSLDKLVLETDAPYMSPTPFRGKRNRSDYMIYVAEKIAEIKNETVEKVIDETSQNAKKLFNI